MITFYYVNLKGCCGIWFPPSGIVTEVPQSLTHFIVFMLDEMLSCTTLFPAIKIQFQTFTYENIYSTYLF